jgi:hypothetical protein
MKRNTIIRKLLGAKITDAQLQLVIGTIDKGIEEAFNEGAKAALESGSNTEALKNVFNRSYLEKNEYLRTLKSR